MRKLMLILVVGMILAVGTVLAVTVITTSDPLSKGLIMHWDMDGDNYDSATNRVGDGKVYNIKIIHRSIKGV